MNSNLHDSFTRSLTVALPTDSWQRLHNLAVAGWAYNDAPYSERETNERVVLNLAWSIWTLLESQWGTDGYVQPNVTVPMMQAFHDLLNIDLGWLDGGTLSSWLVTLAERYDIKEVL